VSVEKQIVIINLLTVLLCLCQLRNKLFL